MSWPIQSNIFSRHISILTFKIFGIYYLFFIAGSKKTFKKIPLNLWQNRPMRCRACLIIALAGSERNFSGLGILPHKLYSGYFQ